MKLPGSASRAWRCIHLLLLSTFLVQPSLAATQKPPQSPGYELELGARVRVRTSAPHRQTLVGTVTALEAHSLQIDVTKPGSSAGTRMDLSLENVTRLEVSQGRKSGIGRGILLGGGLGLATGATAGAILGFGLSSYPEYRNSEAPVRGALVLGGIGLAAGVGIGAIIGAMSKVESWHGLSLDRLRVSILPDSRSGAPIGGSVRFEVAF